jgi:DNA-damage-inducible protein J
LHKQCIDIFLFEKYNIVKEGVDDMATTNITMRMDEDLKSQLQELVSNLGMDMTTFFTISAKQAVREQRIPFAISMDVPNADTIRAIDDVRHGRNLSRSFSSVEELMEDLNAED